MENASAPAVEPAAPEKKPATLDDVLFAQRELYKKFQALEAKVDKLINTQAAMRLPGAKVKKPPNPEFTVLKTKLEMAWHRRNGSKYEFSGKDAKGVAALLKRGKTIDEILIRWDTALQAGCSSILLFELNFAKWAPVEQSTRPMVTGDIYKGDTRG